MLESTLTCLYIYIYIYIKKERKTAKYKHVVHRPKSSLNAIKEELGRSALGLTKYVYYLHEATFSMQGAVV